MGLWSGTKKTAKYVVWGMPKALFGVDQLRLGHRQVVALYRSLTWPVCPYCHQGTLNLTSHEDHPWYCGRCDSRFAGPRDAKEARVHFALLQRDFAVEQLQHMQDTPRAELAHGHTMRSRWYFGVAGVMAVGFLYMLASGATLIMAANWLALGFAMFSFGLKASYRAWQVTTGVIFQEGSFKRWLLHGRWFI